MAVSELEARQAAISMLGGDPNMLIDAYEELLGHRTRYEQIHTQHSADLVPIGHEALVITRLMGEKKYNMAQAVLSKVVQLTKVGRDSVEGSNYN